MPRTGQLRTPHSTTVSVSAPADSHPTHLQRGVGGRPLGNSSGKKVTSSAREGNQVMSASQVASAAAGRGLGPVNPYWPYSQRGHVDRLQQPDRAEQRPDRIVRPMPDHHDADPCEGTTTRARITATSRRFGCPFARASTSAATVRPADGAPSASAGPFRFTAASTGVPGVPAVGDTGPDEQGAAPGRS